MYNNNVDIDDHENEDHNEDDQFILITTAKISLEKMGLTMYMINIAIYLLAYLTLESDERSYTTSRIFFAYIVFSMLNAYVVYLNYKRDLLVVNHPVSRQFYASLLSLNKWPTSLLKFSKLVTLGLGIYFCSIFLTGCGPYRNGGFVCGILRLISVQELLVPVMMLLYYTCILIQLCTVLGMHRARHQTRNQLVYQLIENLTVTTVGEPNNTNDTTCVICQSDTIQGEEWKVLPCGHGFHPVCIDQWLTRNNTCPTCRRALPTAPSI